LHAFWQNTSILKCDIFSNTAQYFGIMYTFSVVILYYNNTALFYTKKLKIGILVPPFKS